MPNPSLPKDLQVPNGKQQIILHVMPLIVLIGTKFHNNK